MKLNDYVLSHTDRNACQCGKCVDPGEDRQLTGHTANVYFFDVSLRDAPGEAGGPVVPPTADRLRELLAEHRGEFTDISPLTPGEHGYIEVGGWIGDQQTALRLIGMGKLLGLWTIMHPGMLPGLPKDMADMMAGSGMVAAMTPSVRSG